MAANEVAARPGNEDLIVPELLKRLKASISQGAMAANGSEASSDTLCALVELLGNTGSLKLTSNNQDNVLSYIGTLLTRVRGPLESKSLNQADRMRLGSVAGKILSAYCGRMKEKSLAGESIKVFDESRVTEMEEESTEVEFRSGKVICIALGKSLLAGGKSYSVDARLAAVTALRDFNGMSFEEGERLRCALAKERSPKLRMLL